MGTRAGESCDSAGRTTFYQDESALRYELGKPYKKIKDKG